MQFSSKDQQVKLSKIQTVQHKAPTSFPTWAKISQRKLSQINIARVHKYYPIREQLCPYFLEKLSIIAFSPNFFALKYKKYVKPAPGKFFIGSHLATLRFGSLYSFVAR